MQLLFFPDHFVFYIIIFFVRDSDAVDAASSASY